MIAMRFIPAVEQLDARLLLTALPLLPTIVGSQSESAVESVMPNLEVSLANLQISTEHNGSESMLLVDLGDLEEVCTICIVDGDTAVTQSDGTARLRLPENARSVDLTISNSQGDLLASIRLEFAEEGHIVQQTMLHDQPLTADSSNYVIPSNHPDVIHTMNLSWSPARTAEMGQDHQTDSGSNADIDSQAVDMAMAMNSVPSEHISQSSNSSGADHFSRGDRDTPAHDDERIGEEEIEAASDHAAIGEASPTVPETASMVAEVTPEESVDAVVANWTGWEESTQTPVLAAYTEPLQTPEAIASEDYSPVAEFSAPYVFAAYMRELPTMAPTQMALSDSAAEPSHLPMIGGIVVSVVAAGAAITLERKAKRARDAHASHLAANDFVL